MLVVMKYIGPYFVQLSSAQLWGVGMVLFKSLFQLVTSFSMGKFSFNLFLSNFSLGHSAGIACWYNTVK